MINSAILNVTVIMGKEAADARRNRWLVLFTIVFAGLALGLSLLGFSGIGTFGIAGFGRTVASLINLVMLIVPLMGLMLGAISISGERERGSLLPLLAQPIMPTELLIGKYLGTAVALMTAILFGFGFSGIVIAWRGGLAQFSHYLMLVGLTVLIGLAHLSIGFLISTFTSKSTTAISIALILWLAIVFISDLGLIGTTVVLRLEPPVLLAFTLMNPVQVFKLATIYIIQGDMEILGAVGLYAADVFGGFLFPMLMILFLLWVFLPLLLSLIVFQRRSL